MATVFVECWKCEQCNHRWIKGELWPTQCAKCRSRRWNGTGQEANRGRDARHTPEPEPSNGGYRGQQASASLPIANGGSGGFTHSGESIERRTSNPVKGNDAMLAFLSKLHVAIPDSPPDPVDDEPKPSCSECDGRMAGKLIKGRGMVYACTDVGCPMYGLERQPK